MSPSPPASLDAAARTLVLRHVRSLITGTLSFFAQNQDAQLTMLRAHLFEQVDTRPHTTVAQNLRTAGMLLDQQGALFNQSLQAALREAIEEELDTVFPGALAALRPSAPEPESESPISMALLDVDEIERHLLVDRVAQRFNQRYEAQLVPLTQSLGVLFRMEEFAAGDNPFRPATLIRAYAMAWQKSEFDPLAAEDFVSVLEPRQCVDWAPLYAGLAQTLVRAGFTAHAVHRIKRAPGHDSAHAPLPGGREGTGADVRTGHGALEQGTAARSGFAPLQAGGGSGGEGGGGSAAGPGLGIAARARQFLQMLGFGGGHGGGNPQGDAGATGGWGAGGDGMGGSGPDTLPGYTPVQADPALMGFLGGLQASVGAGPVSSQFPRWLDGQDIGDPNVLRRMRERDEVRNAPEIDRGTIDALAEVFDYVFADRAIPMQLKIVIGRLQIPVLKAAMIDRDFFLSPAHPARQLIDALASASVAWMPEKGEADPLYVRIDATVKRVLAEFDNDLALFGVLLDEFKAWLAQSEAQAQARIEPAADQERGGEAQTLALAHVDEVVHQCIVALPPGEPLQPFLLPFLTTQWREVLAQAWLRREATPAGWDAAVRTMDELVWSTQPKPLPEDRARLVALLPNLVGRLNASLDVLGWQGEERANFMRRLIDTHMKAIRTAKATTVAAPVESGPDELEAAAGRNALQALDARRAEQAPVATPQDDWDAMAQAFARGQWFDLTDAQGQARRYRLGWVSPQRTRMLFTNRDGFDAIVHSEREVATLLREGRLHPIDDQPIVARAIDQIMASAEKMELDMELL